MPAELTPACTTRFAQAKVFSAGHIMFPEISYAAFSYPGDEEALNALKSVPGAAALLTWLSANYMEQIAHLENNEHNIKVGPTNFRSLYSLVERCSEVLSCPLPELYITSSPIPEAYTYGQRRTHVVLSRGVIDLLTADELSFVVGHELGHIKAGHGVYRALGMLLTSQWDLVTGLIPVPGLGLLRTPLLLAYWEWYRRSEFTCDRAGLLCVQDVKASQSALAKVAGSVTGIEDELEIDSVISQVESRKEVNKLVLLVSILNNYNNSHPWTPSRLKQLREYASSDDLRRLVGGEYKRDTLGLHEGGERVACRCGTIVNSKLSFCPECGRGLRALSGDNSCEKCETPLPAGTKFCPKCGSQQSEAAVPAASTLTKLRNTASSFFKQ